MTPATLHLRRWLGALALVGLGLWQPAWSAAAAAAAAAPTPARPRIADAWFAHNALLAMLGASGQVVATVARPQSFVWLYRVAPDLHQAEPITGGTMNAEELLRLKTDLVFVTPADPSAEALRRAGLNVIPVSFTDVDSMLRCIDLTARAVGGPLALQRATDYRRYLEQALAEVKQSVAAIPAPRRPRVLHLASVNPLKVDGADTIVDQWITAAGGRNAADGLRGNLQTVSIEQVLAWNPDVIIIAGNGGTLDSSPSKALWDDVPAVRAGRVYRNPSGVFPWDRYGPELALQLRWAAQVLHPELKAGPTPLVQRTQAFYQRFFAYDLSAADAAAIIAAR